MISQTYFNKIRNKILVYEIYDHVDFETWRIVDCFIAEEQNQTLLFWYQIINVHIKSGIRDILES